MLKRIGILGFVLSVGALVAPVSAFARDRRADGGEHRGNARVVEEYRAPVRHDDWDRGRNVRREDRVVIRTAPVYYAPEPACGYGR